MHTETIFPLRCPSFPIVTSNIWLTTYKINKDSKKIDKKQMSRLRVSFKLKWLLSQPSVLPHSVSHVRTELVQIHNSWLQTSHWWPLTFLYLAYGISHQCPSIFTKLQILLAQKVSIWITHKINDLFDGHTYKIHTVPCILQNDITWNRK